MTYKIIVWILTIFFTDILKPVKLQFGMPLFAPPIYPGPAPIFPAPAPIFPMPAPIPMMAPAILPLDTSSSEERNSTTVSTTATTTTTKKAKKKKRKRLVAVPVPMPMPMPMAAPSFCQKPPPTPKSCPPCPPCTCAPSCTPSAFSYCSPCHSKCRCKNPEDTPKPVPPKSAYAVPISIIGPPPVVLAPFPPPVPVQIPPRRRPWRKPRASYTSRSDDSTETSSSESDFPRRRRFKHRRKPNIYRRNLRSSESDNELVKPMLSYIAENGDIKFETKISNDDVAELLGEKEIVNRNHQTVQVFAGGDESKNSQLIVLSKDEGPKSYRSRQSKQVALRGGVTDHKLGSGKKELIFRAPDDKKISNLSLSFQIS